ncbi:hypothetical protein AMET1_0529 [Methanonatronarchaeum thermophilum]|uniref:Uncharacterized protein n=1 Tax=Methanonatronarchaeum thermophilum TaxID=1927129 RepID=A0A1Y3GBS4_9EURY|nr:hypothetical protein [Methanonatronarchaeum thermophilum]OUJ18878.1 hypothetical protein AMET1_0529 [Methanonatronarchaeum thermophilum]
MIKEIFGILLGIFGLFLLYMTLIVSEAIGGYTSAIVVLSVFGFTILVAIIGIAAIIRGGKMVVR